MPGLDFLDGPAPAPDATLAPEPVIDLARGPDGKFVSAQPDAAPAAELAPAPAAEQPKPEPGHVPLSALMDERDKRKAAEERATAAEAARPAAEAPYLDPDTENALLQLRLNTSEELVRDKEGDETVDAAKAWAIERFKTSPAYQAEVLAKPNPYKFVVAEHKAHLKLQATQDLDLSDLDAFKAWKAAGGNAAPPAQAQTAAAIAAPPTPPRSLASAASAGGNVNTAPTGPGVAFDAVIK